MQLDMIFSSNLKFLYPNFVSMSVKHHMCDGLSNISLAVGPLWTSLLKALFTLADSRHSYTFQLGLGTRTKLLHHSDVS